MLTSYLIGIISSTIITFLAWGLVLWYFDPTLTGGVGLVSFYTTLIFWFCGVLTLIFYGLKKKVLGPTLTNLLTSIRQGVSLGLVFVLILLLQNFRLLTWWNILILILAFIVVEVYQRVKVE